MRPVGTHRFYQLDPAGIDAIRPYFEQLWRKSLAAFKGAAEQEKEDRRLMTEQLVEQAVQRTVTVDVSVERAVAVFVEQFGTWWPPAFHIGTNTFTDIVVEPRVGGAGLSETRRERRATGARRSAGSPRGTSCLPGRSGRTGSLTPSSSRPARSRSASSPKGRQPRGSSLSTLASSGVVSTASRCAGRLVERVAGRPASSASLRRHGVERPAGASQSEAGLGSDCRRKVTRGVAPDAFQNS